MSVLDREILALMRGVADAVIMPRYRNLRDSEIVEKASDDLVTIADREAEVALAEGLARLLPEASIVGEEAVHADPDLMERLTDLCWIIDPIDGTANFASGEGHFAVMIALAENGIAEAGWIFDPRRDRLCAARRDGGAFIDGERVRAAASGAAPPALAAMTRFMKPAQRDLFEREILPYYSGADAPGCSAEQYPLVALGEHDIAIYERTLPWDHAAGSLFLSEAGGRCARQDGSPYRVDDGRKGMIAAATPELWDEFVRRLNASGYSPGG